MFLLACMLHILLTKASSNLIAFHQHATFDPFCQPPLRRLQEHLRTDVFFLVPVGLSALSTPWDCGLPPQRPTPLAPTTPNARFEGSPDWQSQTGRVWETRKMKQQSPVSGIQHDSPITRSVQLSSTTEAREGLNSGSSIPTLGLPSQRMCGSPPCSVT